MTGSDLPSRTEQSQPVDSNSAAYLCLRAARGGAIVRHHLRGGALSDIGLHVQSVPACFRAKRDVSLLPTIGYFRVLKDTSVCMGHLSVGRVLPDMHLTRLLLPIAVHNNTLTVVCTL